MRVPEIDLFGLIKKKRKLKDKSSKYKEINIQIFGFKIYVQITKLKLNTI